MVSTARRYLLWDVLHMISSSKWRMLSSNFWVPSTSAQHFEKNGTKFLSVELWYCHSSFSCLSPTLYSVLNVFVIIFATSFSTKTFVLSDPVFRNIGNSFAAWCSTPTRCTTSQSNSNSWRWHWATFFEACDIVNSHIKDLWSVLTVDQYSSRYGWSSITACATARKSLCVICQFFATVFESPGPITNWYVAFV